MLGIARAAIAAAAALTAPSHAQCNYGMTICGPGVISSGASANISVVACSWDTFDVIVSPAQHSYGFVFTGPRHTYGHVAYVSGNLCVGAPQWRHHQMSFVSHGGATAFLSGSLGGRYAPGDSLYAQVWWRDYEDGEAAFSNAQVVPLPW